MRAWTLAIHNHSFSLIFSLSLILPPFIHPFFYFSFSFPLSFSPSSPFHILPVFFFLLSESLRNRESLDTGHSKHDRQANSANAKAYFTRPIPRPSPQTPCPVTTTPRPVTTAPASRGAPRQNKPRPRRENKQANKGRKYLRIEGEGVKQLSATYQMLSG